MTNISFIVTLLFLIISLHSYSQTYTDSVYRPEIKSIEFYNTAKQASFPIITLQSPERVLLAFDDLRSGNESYAYTIEHCDDNWNSSNISTAEYLQNFTDDKIINYSLSTNTVRKYTHYELKLPNENIAPKISGNYILKVYDDGDPSKLVLTRRFYVVNPRISINAQVVPSNDVSTRQTNQKINFTLDYGSLRVQNPGADIRTLILQNGRSDISQLNTQPTYIRGSQLIYNDNNINDFPGGNEFRHFDTRSMKLNSQNIAQIVRGDTANNILLLTDPDRSQPNYTFEYDLNGSFYIINQDGIDPRNDADYSHLFFSLATKRRPNDGTAYIVGRFNDYKIDAHNKMVFDASSNQYLLSLFLKQGVYDYQYVWVDKNGKADFTALEGSHFETENDYHLLVYYKPPGARWEELIGYQMLNSVKK